MKTSFALHTAHLWLPLALRTVR